MTRGLAYRRAQRQRIERKRRREIRHLELLDETGAKVTIDTPCRCSRQCCGNPRRHFGAPTLQEQKAEQLELDGITECDNA